MVHAYTTEFPDTIKKPTPYYSALELHSTAAPSVGGITAQSIQPQGEIPEKGRTEKKPNIEDCN